jgi:hypothetical protein
VVSIFVFSLVGRPSIWVAVVSRVALVPVIAAISYELIRLSAAHAQSPLSRLLAYPGLLFQRMTTRQPDRAQIEVAVAAMTHALAADGKPYAAQPGGPPEGPEEANPPRPPKKTEGPHRRPE